MSKSEENPALSDVREAHELASPSSAKSKPMNILLGDTTMMMKKVVQSPGWRRVMHRRKGANWTLDKTDLGLYWDLGEEVESLQHQFMIFQNPTIYLFFNYRGNQSAIELLNGYSEMITRDLAKQKVKLLICGMNYGEIKIHQKIKKEILKWCLAREEEMGEGNCDYLELKDLDQVMTEPLCKVHPHTP